MPETSGLLIWQECQAHRVDAVAQVSWVVVALAGEDMPEVTSARRTPHLCANHSEASILDLNDCAAGQW